MLDRTYVLSAYLYTYLLTYVVKFTLYYKSNNQSHPCKFFKNWPDKKKFTLWLPHNSIYLCHDLYLRVRQIYCVAVVVCIDSFFYFWNNWLKLRNKNLKIVTTFVKDKYLQSPSVKNNDPAKTFRRWIIYDSKLPAGT